MGHYLQGLTMGLAYVAPIGLQNLFLINSALTNPRPRAFFTACVVTLFDISLALACFWGVGALMQRYPFLEQAVLLVGSLIVLAIGIGLIRAKPGAAASSAPASSLGKIVSTACVVTWFNPQALIDGTMMLGAFRASLAPAQATPFITGVVSASCLWFFGLTTLVSLFSRQFSAGLLRKINVVCGVVILFYGGKLLFTFLSNVL